MPDAQTPQEIVPEGLQSAQAAGLTCRDTVSPVADKPGGFAGFLGGIRGGRGGQEQHQASRKK